MPHHDVDFRQAFIAKLNGISDKILQQLSHLRGISRNIR